MKTILPPIKKVSIPNFFVALIQISLQVKMGKQKKKANSAFKVAGAKSLKLKSKAKVVKTNLKNVSAYINDESINLYTYVANFFNCR